MDSEARILKKIGRKIKEKRTEKGYTLRALGKRMDIPFSSLHKWEQGDVGMNVDTFFKIASYLGIDPAEFVQFYENEQINKMEILLDSEIVFDKNDQSKVI